MHVFVTGATGRLGLVVEELLGAGHRVTGLASSVKAGAALAAAGAGVLPATVLRRAFGPALVAHLADPRFDQVIQQDARQYEEVLLLAKRIGHR